jgi:hypothetical protein
MEMDAVLGAETAVSTNNQEHVTVTRQQQLWLKAQSSKVSTCPKTERIPSIKTSPSNIIISRLQHFFFVGLGRGLSWPWQPLLRRLKQQRQPRAVHSNSSSLTEIRCQQREFNCVEI